MRIIDHVLTYVLLNPSFIHATTSSKPLIYTPVTSSSATLTSSNITNIINENKLHNQRKQQQQNPNIWNNIRGSFKLNNNTSSSGLGGGIAGGGGQKQKTIYNSITGGLGLDGSSLHTNISNLGSIREEGSDEEDEDPVCCLFLVVVSELCFHAHHMLTFYPLSTPSTYDIAHGSYGLSRR